MGQIVVTGARGFIGRHFMKRDDRRLRGFSFSTSPIRSDLFTGVDTVVHFAALVHCMKGKSESEYKNINTERTYELAQAAKAGGAHYFLFMSTVKVYGNEREQCYDEATQCSPSDAYGYSKLEAERRLQSLESDTFRVGIIRSPLVYGEGVGANMRSLIRLVERTPLLPFGASQNRRSMIGVGNLVTCIDQMVEHRTSGIYNVADPEPVSTEQLVMWIAQGLGKRCHLFHAPWFERLLEKVFPGYYRRLYGSLCIDTSKLYREFPLLQLETTQTGILKMMERDRRVD